MLGEMTLDVFQRAEKFQRVAKIRCPMQCAVIRFLSGNQQWSGFIPIQGESPLLRGERGLCSHHGFNVSF